MKTAIDVSRLRHRISHAPRQPIPWFASPVDKGRSLPPDADRRGYIVNGENKNPNLSLLSSYSNHPMSSDSNDTTQPLSHETTYTSTATSTRDPHACVFKRRHESTAIELFYDLFFVANLTIFTDNNEIADSPSMASYLGFFSLIWFTWFQVSLYDVRFATNSFFNRFCKAIHLFVMGLFAFSGANFNTSDVEDGYSAFRIMSYALLLQRVCLIIQYGTLLWCVRKYRAATIPIACTLATMCVTAAIFLGLVFSFPQGKNLHSYIALYVVSLTEAMLVVIISCTFRDAGYRHTNLIERVGLLTLIIIGEGVIGVVRSIATSMLKTNINTRSMYLLAFSSLMLLHELWILYFDQVDNDRFGTIRQQLWAILHFPLHMSMILALQGLSRFLIFKTFWDCVWRALNVFSDPLPGQTGLEYANALGENLTTFSDHFRHGDFSEYYNYLPNLTYIAHQDLTKASAYNETMSLLTQIAYWGIDFVCDQLEVTKPEDLKGAERAEQIEFVALKIFGVAFYYFIIGSGCILIILGVMYWFGKRHKSRFEWASLLLRLAAGIGLALVALTTLTGNGDSNVAVNIIESQWTIPIVLLVNAAVIFLDDVLIYFGWKRYEATKNNGHWEVEPPREDPLGQEESS